MFRRLQAHHPRREARIAATAFGVFAPVALGVAFAVSPIFGVYSEVLFRSAFAGALVGIVVIMAILSFVPIMFLLWMMRREEEVRVRFR